MNRSPFLALLLAVAPVAFAQRAEQRYEIRSASRSYDFLFTIRPGGEDLADTVIGPGSLVVREKSNGHVLETLQLDSIVLTLKDDHTPLVNANRLYDDQGVLNVGDFNFDGHEDFAVQTGHNGPYGGPTYAVFLFNPKTGRHESSPAFNRLIEEDSLGFPNFRPREKRIVAMTKSGCCDHTITTYAIRNNIPVATVEEEWVERSDGMETHTKRVRAQGQWKTVLTQTRPAPKDTE